MANRTWTNGAADQDWNVAANWSGAAVPVNADNVIFTGSIDPPVGANLDQGGVKLGQLLIDRSYTGGSIGGDGTPLIIAAAEVRMNGGSGLYFQHGSHVDTLVTDLITIDCKTAATIVQISSEESDDDEISHVLALRGTVTIAASNGDIPRLSIGSRTDPVGDVNVTYPTSAKNLDFLKQKGGLLTCGVLIGDADIQGGRCLKTDTAITSGHVRNGWLDYRDDGTIALLEIDRAGIVDLMQTVKALTMTTLIRLPGSELRHNPTLHAITNNIDLREAAAA